MSQLRFVGFVEGFNKVQLNHALREMAGMSLSVAKHVVDQILDGETVIVSVEASLATGLLARARQCGALVTLE